MTRRIWNLLQLWSLTRQTEMKRIIIRLIKKSHLISKFYS